MKSYNKHVIIVGTARSGTSWLSETIAQQHRYRMLFEPEEETRTNKGYLLCDQWIENPTQSPEAHHYLRQVFANRVDCDWIAQNSNRNFKRHLLPFIPKKYIIKFVRANLMAKYMNEYFKIPVIHMIRNPYDVLFSQQRANFPWLVNLSHFAQQDLLVNLIKEHFEYNIKEYMSLTKLQILTLRWCIENVIPLEVLQPYQYTSNIVRYEDLFSDISVFYALCNNLNLEPIVNIEDVYRQPSSKTHRNSTIRTNETKVKSFNHEEMTQINEILDAFRTRLYARTH